MLCRIRWRGWNVGSETKKAKNGEVGATRRRRNSTTNDFGGEPDRVELDALLAGHCRQAVTLLPRGVLGVATAIEFLGALPGAYRLGLPDVTDSGPKLFALLVGHGLLASLPSPRVVPAALALVAGVSPLLQARSARQWTLWIGQVRERGSSIVAALRERTPAAQVSFAPPIAATVRPLRVGALRADRDRLAAELACAVEERTLARSEADRELARADGLARQVELAEKDTRREVRDDHGRLFAAIRQAVGIADDDPRNLPELVLDVLRQRREQATRAEKAEQGLHRVLADLASAAEKIAALEQEMTELETELDDYEVELAQANAEISLRKSRSMRPDQREVDDYRAAGAAEARRVQQRRRAT